MVQNPLAKDVTKLRVVEAPLQEPSHGEIGLCALILKCVAHRRRMATIWI
jgi:hypothetical protein